ncbi:MAG: glycoside hydrolase family 15 protein [Thermoplasmata archaeon]
MRYRGDRVAFGSPGMPPRWSHSNKDGIGTAYSADSRLWFTVWRGIITEVYFPTIDRPQLRDLQLLFTDGAGLFQEEKRDLTARIERMGGESLAYRSTSEDPNGRYTLRKIFLADPHLPCLLTRVNLKVTDPDLAPKLRAFVLASPHLNVAGWGNSASVQEILGRSILLAEKDGVALALGADVPFRRSSVGYVGASDGWTDMNQHRDLTWEFDRAPDGNVALTGEIPAGSTSTEFTLGLAFGENVAAAVTALFQSLGTPFETHERRFLTQWRRSAHSEATVPSGDGGALYRASRAILLAHEDKTYPGAFIASLSIPWGSSKSDEDQGGYHLVWVRDLCHAATGLLATGQTEAPLRALIYLATRQQPDGGFPQNFWVDGRPYWRGLQLDEVALPILLADALRRHHALRDFDPTLGVLRAARFLLEHGPATQQDRWEEVSGYSPSTLATCIAALTVAAGFSRRTGDEPTATFIQEYADFLERHVESWTVTTRGTLVDGIPRHYVRIRPIAVDNPVPDEGPDFGRLHLPNLPPGSPSEFSAHEIIDAGFLDLVRLGIRRPDDPVVMDSLRVVDQILKITTPKGDLWHRYNHDGYGETPAGGPYVGFGVGRVWPILTGERGMYELDRGGDPTPYVRTLEQVATSTGLLPEQVWDEADRPDLHLFFGKPTESATPLVWAHAEYVKLLRSMAEGHPFDQVPEVAERYRGTRTPRRRLEVWKFNRRPVTVRPDTALRVQANQPFRLRASNDDWATEQDFDSTETTLGLHYFDLESLGHVGRRWTFTFFWPLAERWEGTNYEVTAGEPRPDLPLG